MEFRSAIAQRILNGESVLSLSTEFKIKRSILYRWRDAYRLAARMVSDAQPAAGWLGAGYENGAGCDGGRSADSRVGAADRSACDGKRFFSKSLQASKGSTLEEQRAWRGALYGEVMQLEGKAGLSITEVCQAARLGRSGFYRHFEEHFPRQADTELRGRYNEFVWRTAVTGRAAWPGAAQTR